MGGRKQPHASSQPGCDQLLGLLVELAPRPRPEPLDRTLDLGGQAKFGPDVQWVESPLDLEVDDLPGRRVAVS